MTDSGPVTVICYSRLVLYHFGNNSRMKHVEDCWSADRKSNLRTAINYERAGELEVCKGFKELNRVHGDHIFYSEKTI